MVQIFSFGIQNGPCMLSGSLLLGLGVPIARGPAAAYSVEKQHRFGPNYKKPLYLPKRMNHCLPLVRTPSICVSLTTQTQSQPICVE